MMRLERGTFVLVKMEYTDEGGCQIPLLLAELSGRLRLATRRTLTTSVSSNGGNRNRSRAMRRKVRMMRNGASGRSAVGGIWFTQSRR